MSNQPLRKQRSRPRPIVRPGGVNDIRLGTPAHPPTFLPPTAAAVAKPKPSITDYTFEQYQAANLNKDQKHALIGKLRDELPIIDRDEVDDVLLRSMGQQLELAVFLTCKMMQVDPTAVKRMLDDQFRKAYGADVEAEGLRKLGLCRVEDVEGAVVVERMQVGTREKGKKESAGKDRVVLDGDEQVLVANARSKKVKIAPRNDTEKEIRAHVARRKRAKHGVKILTVRSVALSQKWEALSCGL
jgi:hypothetical protein